MMFNNSTSTSFYLTNMIQEYPRSSLCYFEYDIQIDYDNYLKGVP